MSLKGINLLILQISKKLLRLLTSHHNKQVFFKLIKENNIIILFVNKVNYLKKVILKFRRV